jgi:hypothetical protein
MGMFTFWNNFYLQGSCFSSESDLARVYHGTATDACGVPVVERYFPRLKSSDQKERQGQDLYRFQRLLLDLVELL